MKHNNIIPLLGLWVDFSIEGSRARYPAAISPWMDNGDLHDYLLENQQITLKDRLCMVSTFSYVSTKQLTQAITDARHSRRVGL